MTMAFRPNDGSRTTSAFGATLPFPSTRTSTRTRSSARTVSPWQCRGRTSWSCAAGTAEDERAFEDLFRRLALSVDWSMTYATIDDRSRRASQRAFLRLLARGLTYQVEAPTMWDVDFRTAVAQAEIEDREVDGTYHRVAFELKAGGSVEIETSRPELIPACVALVVNPEDQRFAELVGKHAVTPLFGARVPIVAHRLADPEKGTGIAMIYTFGDMTDVVWWRELSLPTRVVVQRDGTIAPPRWGQPGWESHD